MGDSGEGEEQVRRISAYRTITTGEWISTFGDYILLVGTLRLAALGAEPTIVE